MAVPIRSLARIFLLPCFCLPVEAGHDVIADPPPQTSEVRLPGDLQLDPVQTTVSGLSSGAFFAHQFHVAHSSIISGAGVIAGGPYGCAEIVANPYLPWTTLNRLAAATLGCTHVLGSRFWGLTVDPPSAAEASTLIAAAEIAGRVDQTSNLENDRVWIFHGAGDRVVPAGVSQALADLYRDLGLATDALRIEDDPATQKAAHGLPVDQFRGESNFPVRSCGEHAPPFIVECGFDAPGEMFKHLYRGTIDNAPGDPEAGGTLAAFDQREFTHELASSSFSAVGYIYIPHQCRAGVCRLHVAFHGCRQNVGSPEQGGVHDDFVRDAGYNRWASANRIVVLYPQLTASRSNPNACWDFWGYTGDAYLERSGVQMNAIRLMIEQLTSRADR
jgi:poly(3-hydroxybutyrate) depolymerase